MSAHQSLEQQRAQHAWKCATEAHANREFGEKYTQLVKKLPALVGTNGLGQTLAFLAAKAKTVPARAEANSTAGGPEARAPQGRRENPHRPKEINRTKEEGLLYHHLEQWLTRQADHDAGLPPGSFVLPADGEEQCATKLLYRITRCDSGTYRQATLETQRLLVWLKSFADAQQEKPETSEEDLP